jgi:hypothetical protein
VDTSHDDDPALVRARRWRRWVCRAGLLVLALLAVGVGFLLWAHHRISSNLADAVAELDRTDPGWRLEEIEAAREKVPDEENSALRVVAAGKLLPKDWPSRDFPQTIDDIPPQEQLTPDETARLEAELEAVHAAVQIARELADLPRGRHHIEYSPLIVDMELEDQHTARDVAHLLEFDVMRCAQAGNLRQALLSCRAILNAGRSIGDEPLLIPQLIRVVCARVACRKSERVLAQGEPPSDEMEHLQRALADEALHPDYLIAMRGERAADHAVFDALETGKVPVSQVEELQPGWQELGLGWGVRHNLRAEHPLMLSLMTEGVRIVQLPREERAAALRRYEGEIDTLPQTTVLTHLLLPNLPMLIKGSQEKKALIHGTVAALACERYRQKEGTWPEKLTDLVPEYLPEVPTDPYDGKPLHFRRLADGLVLYAVGPDGQDDGGTLERASSVIPGTDVGFRLWDVAERRQPPSPRPAKPEDPLPFPEITP